MELVLLGTACGCRLRPNRHATAQVVIVGGEPLLFDCGEGATRQLLKAGILPANVEHLFFSHHHLDHNSDYIYFAFTTSFWGRDRNLKVYGPPEIARMTELLFGRDGVYRQDQRSRTEWDPFSGMYKNRTGRDLPWIEIDVTEIESPGPVCRSTHWRVTATFTDHIQPYMDTVAYRVDSEEGSIAIAVDSAPTQAVIDLAKDADILVHECSATEEFIERFALQRAHSGPKGVAEVAIEANVRKLVLTHFFYEMEDATTLAEMAEEVGSIFPGEVYLGEDLMRVKV